jgi:hypothetical protein
MAVDVFEPDKCNGVSDLIETAKANGLDFI